jgi:gluconolactonase
MGAIFMSWKFELLNKPYGGVTEGPAWDGEAIYFTHILGNRIMRYSPSSGDITEWRGGTNRTNGLAHDLEGRLFGCCAGGRSIVRFDPDGQMTTIAERIDGKKLHTPNDLAIDRRGRIWFTNPWNEALIDPDEQPELDHKSVLRADPQPDGGYIVRRMTFDTTMPNGILISPDQRTLYVAESGFALNPCRELRAYPIRGDGGLDPYVVLHTFGADAQTVQRGIDGMCLDAEGNIVACAGWEQGGPGPMLYVFSPTGRVLETHPVPALRPTNCCFGGADMATLYVTTIQGHFFRVQTDRVGWAMYP